MKITAAVLHEPGGKFTLEEAELDDPRAGEIVVQIAGTGVCHTDMSFRDGSWPFPMPAVLGHEGAGVVVAVGSGVTEVVEGDHVVLSSASCGHCSACLSALPNECEILPQLNMAGARPDGSATMHGADGDIHANFVAQSSFASHALTQARFVIKIPKDLPLPILGTLGCGVMTGAGGVLNALRPRPGSAVAVFGLGGVGLSAIAAARASGCRTIIAVDVNPARFELARTFGATEVFDASVDDPAAGLREMTGGGLDGVIEASGAPRALRTAFDSTHSTGTTVLLGAAPYGTEYSLDSMSIMMGRTLTGALMGRSNPKVFIPELIELYRNGGLPLDAMTQTYPMADIEQAFADAKGGSVVKAVLLPA